MKLIIELDSIEDSSKKKFIIQTLEFLGIRFRTVDDHQTLEQYNRELEDNDAEIESGRFISTEDLLKTNGAMVVVWSAKVAQQWNLSKELKMFGRKLLMRF